MQFEVILHDDWSPATENLTQEQVWEFCNRYQYDAVPFGPGYIAVVFYEPEDDFYIEE